MARRWLVTAQHLNAMIRRDVGPRTPIRLPLRLVLRRAHGDVRVACLMVDDLTVSIIVPVFNRASMIIDAIASARAGAGSLPVEIIVVDDASTDGTWQTLEKLEDPQVRLLRQERNGGQSAARNRGLEVARGRYVKFLDSDDVLLAGHLASEVAALEAGADIAVSGWIEEAPDGSRSLFDAPVFHSIVDDVLAGRAVPTSAALYRRRGDWRWDPSLRKLDDWDYFCHAALGATRIDSIGTPAYVLRHHAGTRATDAGMLANAREHHSILRKIEDRLRAEGSLTSARKARLAQYYYKELRVLCLHDPEAFERALEHITELDPGFRPHDEERQAWMRLLARGLGVRRALRLHTAIKRAVQRRA